MAYLLTQMLFCLTLAALVGAAVGWIINGYRASRTEKKIRTELMRQSLALNQAETDNKMIEDDYRDLKYQSEESIALLKEENNQLPVLHQNLEKSQTLVRQMLQKHGSEVQRLTSENESLIAKVRELEGREKAVTKLQMDLNTERLQVNAKKAPEKSEPAATHQTVPPIQRQSTEQTVTTHATPAPVADSNHAEQAELSLDENIQEKTRDFGFSEHNDKLQDIFGIGPVTVKTLNALGITSYDQIARFDRADIEYIAEELQIFPGRIETDNWVGSARKLVEARQASQEIPSQSKEQLEDA